MGVIYTVGLLYLFTSYSSSSGIFFPFLPSHTLHRMQTFNSAFGFSRNHPKSSLFLILPYLFHTTHGPPINIWLLLMMFLIMQVNSFPFIFSQPACIFLPCPSLPWMEYSPWTGSWFFLLKQTSSAYAGLSPQLILQ